MVAGLSKLITVALAILIFGLIGGASPYAQVATDGTAGPRAELTGPDFEIVASLGIRFGRNLFHSFGQRGGRGVLQWRPAWRGR